MGTTLRLTLKASRFEVVSTLIAGWAVALAALLLPALVPGQAGSEWVGRTFAAAAALPFLAGLILGVPLVSRELESGTAVLAWTLGRSRRRWFLTRLSVLGGVMIAALAPAAAATERLEGWQQAAVSPGQSLVDYGARGWPLLGRGLLILAVAALLGLILGRQLPALIVAVVSVAIALLVGAAIVRGYLDGRSVYLPMAEAGSLSHAGDLDTGLVECLAPDGRILSVESALAMESPGTTATPNPQGDVGDDLCGNAQLLAVVRSAPGQVYPDTQRFELGLEAAGMGACIGAALVVLPVRRAV
ncbi:MAG TPA: hypothetical protein VFW92_00870 [Candidatus Limnocylindrales bacterium]|nr:hypothetical protein [Candidatus Limnocylindrales bacterium]